MTDDYTPTTARVCIDFCNAAVTRRRMDGTFMTMDEADAAFDRWLASVLAEQGDPEWEYRISDGEFIHYTRTRSRVARAVQRGLDVRRRIPEVPRIPAGPWLPVEENGENT